VTVGSFAIDAGAGELITRQGRIRIEGKPCELLLALAERPGDLLTRPELYKRLWPDISTDYQKSLDTAVKKLRKALRQAQIADVFVETLHRRGYRLVALAHHNVTGAKSPAGGRSGAAPADAARLRAEGRDQLGRQTPSSVRSALALFLEARRLQSYDAHVHLMVAVTQVLLACFGDEPPLGLISDARLAALESIRLDNSAATAYSVLACIRGAFHYDLDGALRDLVRAMEMEPELPLSGVLHAYLLSARGRPGEALAALRKTPSLNAASAMASVLRSSVALLSERFDSAEQAGRDAVEQNAGFGPGHLCYGQALLWAGKPAAAIRHFERAAELLEGLPPVTALLGAAHAAAGDLRRARELDAGLDATAAHGYADPYHRAILKHALGSDETAVALLEAARDSHSPWFALAAVDPRIEGLRKYDRARALLLRLHE
jgi:DNA-binding winged helix-turn-helix (wHTH) protein